MLTRHQIWKSLGLDVTSIETGPSGSQATSWTVSLDYSEHRLSPEKVKPHKLSPDLPYHDIKPPLGVNVIKIQAFRVKMLLETSPTATSSKTGLCKHDGIYPEDENTTFGRESLFFNGDSADDGHFCFDIDAETCDTDNVQYLTVPCDDDGRQDVNISTADGSCAYLTPPSSQEKEVCSHGESVLYPLHDLAYHPRTETLLFSLETGLRHVMCNLPNYKSKTNVIVSNEDFDPFPAIAPALWVPNYHQSLSDRAVFLPTISQAIANVSGHGSAKLGLRIKARQLSHRYPHLGEEVSSASAAATTNETQTALSASLWTEMTAGLNNANTAQQLRQLLDTFESTREVGIVRDAEDMLDGAATDCGSDETSDDSDFEDLINMAKDADDESTCDWSVSDNGHTSDSCSTKEFRDNLPSPWDLEDPSLFDPDCGMAADNPELDESVPREVGRAGDDGGGDYTGSHREVGQGWNGSDHVHDSMTLQYPQKAKTESEAENMLM